MGCSYPHSNPNACVTQTPHHHNWQPCRWVFTNKTFQLGSRVRYCFKSIENITGIFFSDIRNVTLTFCYSEKTGWDQTALFGVRLCAPLPTGRSRSLGTLLNKCECYLRLYLLFVFASISLSFYFVSREDKRSCSLDLLPIVRVVIISPPTKTFQRKSTIIMCVQQQVIVDI